jgi:hypothetical protein
LKHTSSFEKKERISFRETKNNHKKRRRKKKKKKRKEKRKKLVLTKTKINCARVSIVTRYYSVASQSQKVLKF